MSEESIDQSLLRKSYEQRDQVKKGLGRLVRTMAGARRYGVGIGQPIGSGGKSKAAPDGIAPPPPRRVKPNTIAPPPKRKRPPVFDRKREARGKLNARAMDRRIADQAAKDDYAWGLGPKPDPRGMSNIDARRKAYEVRQQRIKDAENFKPEPYMTADERLRRRKAKEARAKARQAQLNRPRELNRGDLARAQRAVDNSPRRRAAGGASWFD